MKELFVFSFFFLDMQAECSDDVMRMSVQFNDSFSGLIYSAGWEKTDKKRNKCQENWQKHLEICKWHKKSDQKYHLLDILTKL